MRTFPHLFTLEWSQDHLRVIAKIEQVVRHRETLAVAMPCDSSHSAATVLRDVGHQPGGSDDRRHDGTVGAGCGRGCVARAGATRPRSSG